MSDLLERILDVWAAPPHDDQEAAAAFRMFYLDPVPVNGAPVAAVGLVARARAVHRAFSETRYEILTQSETLEQIAVAFALHGIHTGPLMTPLGEIKPTGKPITLRTLDILTLSGGRVSEVWMAADELGALAGLGAVTLTTS